MDKRKEFILKALSDSDEEIRKVAAQALEKLELRGRLDFLEKNIKTGSKLEKLRSIYAIGGLRGKRIVEILTGALKDPVEDVRATALRMLSDVWDERVLPYLVESLKDPSPVVRRVAIDGIGNFRDHRLLKPLLQMLKDPDPGVVERAIEIIGRIGDRRCENAMLYFMVKGNNRMKVLAIKALGEMDGER